MNYIKNNKENIISGLFMLVLFVFMMLNMANKSFVLDELDWTIKFIDNETTIGMLSELLKYGYNLPLFYLVMRFMLAFLPRNEVFMLLPCMIFVVSGVVFIVLSASKILGKRAAMFAAVMSCTMGVLVSEAGWKFRPYSLLFLMSAMTLYAYIGRLEKESVKAISFLGVSMLMLMYTHWFGALVCVIYGVYDLIRIYKKEIKIRSLLVYIVAAVLYFPWLILLMKCHVNDLSDYWAMIPDINSIISTLSFLFGRNRLLVLFWIYSFVIIVASCIIRCRQGEKKSLKDVVLVLSELAYLWVFTSVFIYSRYVNPDGSLYVHRYFIVCLPHLILTLVAGCEYSIQIVKKHLGKKINIESIAGLLEILIVVVFIIFGSMSYAKAIKDTLGFENHYRDSAKYIADNMSDMGEDTLVVSSIGTYWVDFYLGSGSATLPSNIAVGSNADGIKQFVRNGAKQEPEKIAKDDLKKYSRIVLLQTHSNFKDDLLNYLSETGYTRREQGPEYVMEYVK